MSGVAHTGCELSAPAVEEKSNDDVTDPADDEHDGNTGTNPSASPVKLRRMRWVRKPGRGGGITMLSEGAAPLMTVLLSSMMPLV